VPRSGQAEPHFPRPVVCGRSVLRLHTGRCLRWKKPRTKGRGGGTRVAATNATNRTQPEVREVPTQPIEYKPSKGKQEHTNIHPQRVWCDAFRMNPVRSTPPLCRSVRPLAATRIVGEVLMLNSRAIPPRQARRHAHACHPQCWDLCDVPCAKSPETSGRADARGQLLTAPPCSALGECSLPPHASTSWPDARVRVPHLPQSAGALRCVPPPGTTKPAPGEQLHHR
jgi:hypothetical protein